jgi:hypothetical protein
MRTACVFLFAVLIVALVLTTNAVVRLENYRYANFVGMCKEYDITDPVERIKRERCLENTETRTHWFAHVLYGLRIL